MKTHLSTPALLLLAFAATVVAAEPDNDFVAHEWGTFTSVQGADGVQMIWNPQIISELPKFIYDRANVPKKHIIVAGKIEMACRQRMETPVLYFYSDRARTVDVSVRFPQGTVTEWYPLESAADTRFPMLRRTVQGPGNDLPILHWSEVQILPSSVAAPSLPSDASGSHYYSARETDASFLRTTANQKSETEKFLFYRGMGDFQAPLTVRLESNDSARVSLTNSGQEELRHLFLYEVRAGGHLAWTSIDKLPVGETCGVSLDAATGAGAESLAAALRAALVHEGLYEKEAAAMVKTWQDSWFSEKGRRVLYTLPRPWTDRTLPLTVTPAPKSVERVMVGRAEIITPAMEQAFLGEVERYMAAKEEDRPKIITETSVLGMGRFTEAARQRLLSGRNSDFVTRSWELVRAAFPKQTFD